MDSESARMTTAEEARFRIDYPNSKPRAVKVVALDPPSERVVKRAGAAQLAARDLLHRAQVRRRAPSGDRWSMKAWLSDLAGRTKDLIDEIATADLVVMVASAGTMRGGRRRDRARPARLRKVMTTALIIGSDAAIRRGAVEDAGEPAAACLDAGDRQQRRLHRGDAGGVAGVRLLPASSSATNPIVVPRRRGLRFRFRAGVDQTHGVPPWAREFRPTRRAAAAMNRRAADQPRHCGLLVVPRASTAARRCPPPPPRRRCRRGSAPRRRPCRARSPRPRSRSRAGAPRASALRNLSGLVMVLGVRGDEPGRDHPLDRLAAAGTPGSPAPRRCNAPACARRCRSACGSHACFRDCRRT